MTGHEAVTCTITAPDGNTHAVPVTVAEGGGHFQATLHWLQMGSHQVLPAMHLSTAASVTDPDVKLQEHIHSMAHVVIYLPSVPISSKHRCTRDVFHLPSPTEVKEVSESRDDTMLGRSRPGL
jgi:hypothetical protein